MPAELCTRTVPAHPLCREYRNEGAQLERAGTIWGNPDEWKDLRTGITVDASDLVHLTSGPMAYPSPDHGCCPVWTTPRRSSSTLRSWGLVALFMASGTLITPSATKPARD